MAEPERLAQHGVETRVPAPVAESPVAPDYAQVERFRRRWTVPEPPPPPDPKVQALSEKYRHSTARANELERERLAWTARRRCYLDELEALFNVSEDPRVDFMRLHERPTGDEACVSIVLRYAFACHLDRMRGERARNADLTRRMRGDASLDALTRARRQLAQEHPDLSYVVERVCFGRPTQTEQAVATELGLHQTTVGKRKWKAFACLRRYLADEGLLAQEDGVA